MATILPIILLDGVVPVAQDFMSNFQALADAIDGIGGGAVLGAANQLAGVSASGGAAEYKTVNGTSVQISVTHAANALTLALTASVAIAASLAVGTNPAQGGHLRLPTAADVRARNNANSADLQIFSTDSSDRLIIGGGFPITRFQNQLRLDIDPAARLVLPGGTDKWAV